MAVFFKATGWNISAAAKIALKRRKKAEKEPSQKKNAGKSPTMRRQPEDLGLRQTSALLPPRFCDVSALSFPKSAAVRHAGFFVFAPASNKALSRRCCPSGFLRKSPEQRPLPPWQLSRHLPKNPARETAEPAHEKLRIESPPSGHARTSRVRFPASPAENRVCHPPSRTRESSRATKTAPLTRIY